MVQELKKQASPAKDLSNQTPAQNHAQRVKQLDYQAQQSEQFQSGGTLNG
jgi:hypothetical protein